MPKTLGQLKDDWDKQGMVGAMKQAQDFNPEQYKLIMRLFWSFLWGTIQAEREELRSKVKGLKIKDEGMGMGTDFKRCDAYNDGLQAVLDLLPPKQ